MGGAIIITVLVTDVIKNIASLSVWWTVRDQLWRNPNVMMMVVVVTSVRVVRREGRRPSAPPSQSTTSSPSPILSSSCCSSMLYLLYSVQSLMGPQALPTPITYKVLIWSLMVGDPHVVRVSGPFSSNSSPTYGRTHTHDNLTYRHAHDNLTSGHTHMTIPTYKHSLSLPTSHCTYSFPSVQKILSLASLYLPIYTSCSTQPQWGEWC